MANNDMQDKKPINICFISNSSGDRGGAERTLPKFMHSLQKHGIKAHVIIPSKGPMISELERLNIEYTVIPFRMWMNKNSTLVKRLLRNVYNLITLIPICTKIIQWKCSIVFSNTITVSVGALAAKITFRKHIWYIREFGFEDHGRTFDLGDKFSYWFIKRFSDFCIFNSLSVEEKYRLFLPSKKRKVVYEGYITSEQINNNVNSVQNFKNQDINNVRCLMIGTIQEGKGHEDAIKSLSELKKNGFNLVLDIVGQGFDYAYKEKLSSLISQNKLEKNVFFHGHLDDPFPMIKNCDIFLMCSRKEAFGIVTLEAMQFGKPVIGTKSGGTEELIINEFNGLLYSSGDFVELSERIKYLLENPCISKKLGENGRTWVFKNFTFDRYIKEMIEIIHRFSD